MTARKQNLTPKAATSKTASIEATSPLGNYRKSSLSTRQKRQRGLLIAFGIVSSCGLVASQINFAKAESDHLGDYAVEAHYLNDADSPLSVDSASASLLAQPVATTEASSTFSEQKTTVEKVGSSHPFVGMIEPGRVAAPIADYVSPPASTTAYTEVAVTPAAEAIPEPAANLLVEASPSASTPAAPIVEVSPESAPNFTPAPSAEEATPAEVTPIALPEGITRPGEYDSIFVDPTDYSVGATEAPDVVVAEQSTGCEFTVSQGQNVPNGACGSGAYRSAGVASSGASRSTANAIAPANRSRSAPVVSAPAVNVGPVSFSASGIRLSTSAAGRAYLNRSVRPVVNLQAAAKFIFPLSAPSPISSLFGFRLHPISGDHRFHAGTDIAAPQGTPVLAAQDGVVAAAGEAGGYGLMVVLEHELEEATLESRYAHLSEIFVESGKTVKKGDVVGLVGSTGNSTGPHLHFEMRELTADGWVLVNPDSLVQTSLARLVKALNNPSQTISFSLDDFKLKNLRANKAAADAKPSPGQNDLPYRPAQPNAS